MTMHNKQPLFGALLSSVLLTLASACTSAAIQRTPKLASGVELSEDGEIARRLEQALDGLLRGLARGELPHEILEPRERDRNEFFYSSLLRGARDTTPMVLKSYPLDGGVHAVTIAFISTESSTVSIPRIAEVEAVPRGSTFRFRSPFETRSARLETKTVGAVTFHFSGPFDDDRAEQFERFRSELSHSIGSEVGPLDYYRFHSLDALLKTYGLVHDTSKCNFLEHDLGFLADDGRRYVTGTGDERYLFGYVRELLQLRAEDPSSVYAPFATGVAACYGGYSLSGDSMETLAEQLRDELARRPDLDFLEEFRKGRGSSVQGHFTHFVLCAFLFDEMQRRHGAQVALQALESGPDDASFLEEVEAQLGVDESGFHALIVDLIEDPRFAQPETGA